MLGYKVSLRVKSKKYSIKDEVVNTEDLTSHMQKLLPTQPFNLTVLKKQPVGQAQCQGIFC